MEFYLRTHFMQPSVDKITTRNQVGLLFLLLIPKSLSDGFNNTELLELT